MILGLVGKPSAGKSTFFSACTMVEVPIANYPFTTIDPNKAMTHAKIECADKDFEVQCNPRTGYCINHERYVPVEIIDVAGLVPGAHEGKGLGNKFLDDLRKADVLIHIVDASGSTDEEGKPVEAGQHDPCKDIKFLEDEIGLWFFGIIEKNWVKFGKVPYESKSKLVEAMAQNLSGLGVKEIDIDKALMKLDLTEKKIATWTEDDKKNFAYKIREISKPIIIAANKCDLETSKENIEKIKKEYPNHLIIPCSADSELALRKAAKAELIDYHPGYKDFKEKGNLNEKQKEALNKIRENVLQKCDGTGVQKIINGAVFDLLKYIAIFPGGVNKLEDSEGNVLPDCFLMPPNSTALDFAYKLHTDFGKNFIRAIDVRTKKMIGKEHILNHRDVIEIVYNK